MESHKMKKLKFRGTSRFVVVMVSVLVVPILSGCVALVTGTQEPGVVVTVDSATLSQGTRGLLQKAKLLGVVSVDRASIKAADLFETRGGYVVKIDRIAAKQGEMTGSERREALTNLCVARGVDVAMLGHVTKTETNNTAMAALTGRAKTTLAWTMDVLACNTRAPDSFGGTMIVDVGIYNGNQAKIEEAMGDEMGGKILDAIGRTKADQVGDSVALTATAPQAQPDLGSASQVRSDSALHGTSQPVKAEMASISPKMTTLEIQKKLLELGYLGGKADGKLGRNTVDALKKFQRDSGLPDSGKPDGETIALLRSAKSK